MCIRDSIIAGLRWNNQETRNVFCNVITIDQDITDLGKDECGGFKGYISCIHNTNSLRLILEKYR